MVTVKPGKSKYSLVGYLMVLPSFTIFFIFMFIPILIIIGFSFTNYDFYKTMDFVGFDNFIRMAKDQIFLISLKNTFVYAVFTILPQISIGLVLAVVMNNKIIGQKIHRLVIFLPYILSMVVASFVWVWIYDPTVGELNKLLDLVGIGPKRWLFNPDLALPSIIFMSLWKLIGYNMVIYLAALQQIPSSIYEAASIDGANFFHKFFKITLPMVSTTTFFLFVIACVWSFNVFEQVNIMTDGGPINATTTVVHQIYERAFLYFQMGYASAMSVLLLLITLLLTITNFKAGGKGTDVDV